MPTYIVGDVHGCYRTLMDLLELIAWQPACDRLVLTGDLVNGPDSLRVLRWARDHEVETVLGNHDIHFLAVTAGIRRLRKKDSFYDLLEAPDRDELTDWLRRRPILIELGKAAAVVHAGLLPSWTFTQAQRIAREVESAFEDSLPEGLFGDQPDYWSEDLPQQDRVRVAVNAMTRMRVLTEDGRIDLSSKGPPSNADDGQMPWFEAPGRAWADMEVFCGHWAALGHYVGNGVVALDSGCVWGDRLTAFRLDDRMVFQVRSECAG